MFQGRQILSGDWTRQSAKQLFLLLISFYDIPMSREKLMNILWPDADERTGRNNFKVTLNCLLNTLEPERRPRMPSTFIRKNKTSLQFTAFNDCHLDIRNFEELVKTGRNMLPQKTDERQVLIREGLDLYKGEYLSGDI